MPSVAQESPAVASSKKRRRDDNSHVLPLAHNVDNDTPRSILSEKALNHVDLLQHHHSLHLTARKILPLPPGKRQRTWVDEDVPGEDEPMQRSPSSSPSTRARQHEYREQDRPHDHSKDAARGNASHEHMRIRSTGTTTTTTTQPPTSTSASLMSRCHICSRKPNKKSDLDSFADCQGCGQRTCYVCIRECLGWGTGMPSDFSSSSAVPTPTAPAVLPSRSTIEMGKIDVSFSMTDADDVEDRPPPPPGLEPGHTEGQELGWARGGGHRQVVCSRCCVERGQDGDVVCLGCLPFVEG